MKKRTKLAAGMLALSLLLSGCVMRTVDELYCLPQRTQANNDLQSVIDKAMENLSYCAPLNGENRQTVQTVDLDGDGVDEYVVLARNNSAEPLKILIFGQTSTGYVLMDTISAYGFAFDFIEFCNVDDRPGPEIIVGRQVGDGVVRSVAVYSLYSGYARMLLEANYSVMLTHDMDLDGRSELIFLQPAGTSGRSSYALLYRYKDGQMELSSQYELPYAADSILSMEGVTLHDGMPAMMITSEEKNLRNFDLFTMQFKRLNHILGPVSAGKLGDSFVSAMDVDLDGDVDLPELIPVAGTENDAQGEKWVLWFDVDAEGNRYDGMYTYFNNEENWYLHMDSRWTEKLTVTREEGTCVFADANGEMVLSIYALSGENRYEQAERMRATILGSSGTTLFVAKLGVRAAEYGITEQRLPRLFYTFSVAINEQGG